eukprot:c10990_g1_i2.p1 GENE.c10990_g1_i2~~c10990_g1_i2.p1  ORF type:complete len:418 (-),score=76.50 c10990_g1_i2:275-1528(-)
MNNSPIVMSSIPADVVDIGEAELSTSASLETPTVVTSQNDTPQQKTPSSPPHVVVFERDQIQHQRAQSTLASLLSSNSTPAINPHEAVFRIIVFVNSGSRRHKLPIHIPKSCAESGAIALVQRQYAALNLTPPLIQNVRYELRLADDDGEIDDDIPMSLEEGVPLSSMGFDTFVLVPTTKVDEKERLKQAMASKDRMMLRVKLPDGTHQTHEFHLDTPLSDILRKVGEKAKFDIMYYQLRLPSSKSSALAALDPSLPLRAADSDELLLQRKPDAPPLDFAQRSHESQSEDNKPAFNFFWTEVTASQYKEFLVTKINKWGNKQDRVMGIDNEQITNNIPTKSATKFLGMAKTPLHASRAVAQVHSVEQTGPSEFRIIFRDGFDLVPTDYIAQTPADCAEIVSKISYLRRLRGRHKPAP